MSKFLKDILTQADCQTYCMGRILWIIGALAFIIVTTYSLYRGGVLDPQNWGMGYGSIMSAGGAGVWAKSKAEPEQ